MNTIIIGVEFVKETCCVCGIVYALESSYHARLLEQRERGQTHCPNGHPWHFRGQSFNDKITRLTLQVQERDNWLDEERKKRDRLEKRIKKGVCLYCKRTFHNLAAHMACKHTKTR